MIRLIEMILSDGSTVWNIEYDGVEIPCVDFEMAMKLGFTMEAAIPGGMFCRERQRRVA